MPDFCSCGLAWEVCEGHDDAAPRMQRRTRVFADKILELIETMEWPVTVRQVAYQAFVNELTASMEDTEYDKVQRMILALRRLGELPYTAIADRTRIPDQPSMWSNASSIVAACAEQYRQDYWENQTERVEVWVEKDALTGVVRKVTREFGVTLYTVRGFSSETLLFEAAEAIKATEKKTTLYILTDHDPAGVAIDQAIRDGLARFGANASVHRLAVTTADITDYSLPTFDPRVKKNRASRDTRLVGYLAKYGPVACELDALHPDKLRAKVRTAIETHIRPGEWDRLKLVEQAQRATLRDEAGKLRLASNPGGA